MMSTISNDKQFRDALNGLNAQQQRLVGALFVENVLGLSDDPRVARSLIAAKDTQPGRGSREPGPSQRQGSVAWRRIRAAAPMASGPIRRAISSHVPLRPAWSRRAVRRARARPGRRR